MRLKILMFALPFVLCSFVPALSQQSTNTNNVRKADLQDYPIIYVDVPKTPLVDFPDALGIKPGMKTEKVLDEMRGAGYKCAPQERRASVSVHKGVYEGEYKSEEYTQYFSCGKEDASTVDYFYLYPTLSKPESLILSVSRWVDYIDVTLSPDFDETAEALAAKYGFSHPKKWSVESNGEKSAILTKYTDGRVEEKIKGYHPFSLYERKSPADDAESVIQVRIFRKEHVSGFKNRVRRFHVSITSGDLYRINRNTIGNSAEPIKRLEGLMAESAAVPKL